MPFTARYHQHLNSSLPLILYQKLTNLLHFVAGFFSGNFSVIIESKKKKKTYQEPICMKHVKRKMHKTNKDQLTRNSNTDRRILEPFNCIKWKKKYKRKTWSN